MCYSTLGSGREGLSRYPAHIRYGVLGPRRSQSAGSFYRSLKMLPQEDCSTLFAYERSELAIQEVPLW